jgi:3,4-dihydroxy 2-butanone 4-phosphate synthase/GTP cyclohydrolase II
MNIMVTDRAVEEISSIEEIIEEAKAGRCFILINDENRANEGSVVIPAQFATAGAIDFISRHARGLIYLALTRQCATKLNLSELRHSRLTDRGTSFALSIEARTGVSRGISAADRARTIEVAINPESDSRDIATPGHIFPFIARDNGVLDRVGYTEAAVDVALLAGLNPSAVICEIVNDEGGVAYLSDIKAFAGIHGIKIGTVADLIAFRLRNERPGKRVLVPSARFTNFQKARAASKEEPLRYRAQRAR